MDGIITFLKGKIYWTDKETSSDEFVLFSLNKFIENEKTPLDNIVARVCDKEYLKEWDNLAPNAKIAEQLFIVRESGKKPRFNKGVAEFSVSHTNGMTAVAFSDVPVGLDVEDITRAPNGKSKSFERVAERFFGIKNITKEEFFYLWTKSEALSKAHGLPLYLGYKEDGDVEYFKQGNFLFAVAVKG